MAETLVFGFQVASKSINLFSSLSQPRRASDFMQLVELLDDFKIEVPLCSQLKCELDFMTNWYEYKWVDPTRTWRQNFKKDGGMWTTVFPNFHPSNVFRFPEVVAHTNVRVEILRLVDAVSMTKVVCNWT